MNGLLTFLLTAAGSAPAVEVIPLGVPNGLKGRDEQEHKQAREQYPGTFYDDSGLHGRRYWVGTESGVLLDSLGIIGYGNCAENSIIKSHLRSWSLICVHRLSPSVP